MREDWKHKSLGDGFQNAMEGIFEAIRGEKHMKFHAFATVLVIVIGLFINLSSYELLALIISVFLVWAAELFNTAIEACVDLCTKQYHPLAKKAKDVAAGAVLVTAFNAFVVGYVVFSKHIGNQLRDSFRLLRSSHQHKALLVFFVVLFLVVVIKSITKTGSFVRGGMPSGHSALAASIFMMIQFVSQNPKVFYLSLLLLILVIQSRVEGKIHTLFETMAGAVLGMSVTYFILYFLQFHW